MNAMSLGLWKDINNATFAKKNGCWEGLICSDRFVIALDFNCKAWHVVVSINYVKSGIFITIVEFQWHVTITVLWMAKVTISHGAGKTKGKINQECEYNFNPFRLIVGVLHSRVTWSWNLHCKSGCLVISVHCRGHTHVSSAGSKQFLATWVQEDEKERWSLQGFFSISWYILAEWLGCTSLAFYVYVWQNTHNQFKSYY